MSKKLKICSLKIHKNNCMEGINSKNKNIKGVGSPS